MTPRVELVWFDVDDEPRPRSTASSGKAGIAASWSPRAAWTTCSAWCTCAVCSMPASPDSYWIYGPPSGRCLVVHDSMPVIRALEALRQARVSMALVVDEYGGVEGVVTVEDVLEAVVGDMPERRLGEEPAIVEREDGSLLMDGMLAVDEVKLALGFDSLPDDGQLPYPRGLHSRPARPCAARERRRRVRRVVFRGGRHGRPAHRQGAGAPRHAHANNGRPAGWRELVSARVPAARAARPVDRAAGTRMADPVTDADRATNGRLPRARRGSPARCCPDAAAADRGLCLLASATASGRQSSSKASL